MYMVLDAVVQPKILDKAGVDRDVKVKDWTDDQAAKNS